jgi:hypothetical protein
MCQENNALYYRFSFPLTARHTTCTRPVGAIAAKRSQSLTMPKHVDNAGKMPYNGHLIHMNIR